MLARPRGGGGGGGGQGDTTLSYTTGVPAPRVKAIPVFKFHPTRNNKINTSKYINKNLYCSIVLNHKNIINNLNAHP